VNLAVRIQGALCELQQKSLEQIHEDTALTWMARAIAARRLYEQTGDLQWLLTAHNAGDEALEHAALSGKERAPELVRFVDRCMPFLTLPGPRR